MKQNIDYWIDTLSPSLIFISGFFLLFFYYFSWQVGINVILIKLFLIAIYYIFFKNQSSEIVVKIDESLTREFEVHKSFFSLSQEAMAFIKEEELVEANSIFEELTGKSINSLVRKEWLKLVHEEDLSSFLDWLSMGEASLDQNFLLRMYNHSSGDLIWLHARKRNIPTINRERVYIISFKDVSDHKTYQDKALESQIQVYTLIDFAPVGIIIFDERGKLDYLNKNGIELLGYSRVELMQMGFERIFAAEERTIVQEEWDRYFKNKQDSFVKKVKILTKAGESLDVVFNCVAVKDLEGKINSYFLTIVDLTETHKLMSENQFYVGLLDNSDAIVVINNDGTIIEANSLFLKSIQSTREDTLNADYRKIFSDDYLLEHFSNFQSSDVYRDEISFVIQDKKLWVERTIIPYFANNKLEHFYIIHKDITERILQEDLIKKKNSILSFITSTQNEFISSNGTEKFEEILEKIAYLKRCNLAIILEANGKERNLKILATYFNREKIDSKFFEKNKETQLIGNLENLLGNPVLNREIVLSNDPFNDPRKGHLPEGHPFLKNVISMPIYRDQEVVGVFALANSEADFTWDDVDQLLPITSSLSTMIFAANELKIRNEVEKTNKELQKQVANQLKQLDEILKSSPDTYIMFDVFGKVEYVSKNDMKLFDTDKYFVVGEKISSKFSYAIQFNALIDDSLRMKKNQLPLTDEINQKEYLVHFINVHNDKEEVVSVVCVIKDVTEQKNYERELSIARDAAIRASSSKTEYLASLHKELEAPLFSLFSLLKLYEEKVKNPDEKSFFDVFKKAANDIDEHLTQYFNLTVSPVRSEENSFDEINFEKIANETLRVNSVLILDKNINFNFQNKYGFPINLKNQNIQFKNFINSLVVFSTQLLENAKVEILLVNDDVEKESWLIKVIFKNIKLSEDVLQILLKNELKPSSSYSFETLNFKRDLILFNVSVKCTNLDGSDTLSFKFNMLPELYLKSEDLDNEFLQIGKVENQIIEKRENFAEAPFVKTAHVYDHRADYGIQLQKSLEDFHVKAVVHNSLDTFKDHFLSNLDDFYFVDLSINFDYCIELIKNHPEPEKKVVAMISAQQDLQSNKIQNLGVSTILTRPISKSFIRLPN